jgi:hypothetical protein
MSLATKFDALLPFLTSSHNSGVETGAPSRARGGISPDCCRASAVAQIINVNAALPRRLRHIRGKAFRVLRDESVSYPPGESSDLMPAELWYQRDHYVQASAPSSLGKASEADPEERLMQVHCGFGC